MNRTQKIFLGIVVILIISKAAIGFGMFFYPYSSSDDDVKSGSNTLINLTNDYRLSHGLKPLAKNARLTQAARNHANDILTKNYFEHTSPDGRKFSDWIKDVDYQYFYVGENLAIDFNDDNQVFQAWLDSPGHLANIIKPQYQEIGIASVRGKMNGRITMVVVQMFGSRVTDESEDADNLQSGSTSSNYFYPEDAIEKYYTPRNLQMLDIALDYLLIFFVPLIFIAYKPRKIKNQARISKPITKRYQAKTFKE